MIKNNLTTVTTATVQTLDAYAALISELDALAQSIPDLKDAVDDAPTVRCRTTGFVDFKHRADENLADELDDARERYETILRMLETDERFSEDSIGAHRQARADKYFDWEYLMLRD